MHHHVRHTAHQVFAETNLRIHEPGRCNHFAGGQIAQVTGNGCGANIDGHSEERFDEAWPDASDHRVVVDRHSDLAIRGAKSGLQSTQRGRSNGEARSKPLLAERICEQSQVAAIAAQIIWQHLYVIRPNNWIDDQAGEIDRLTNDRTMHLARSGDVDNEITSYNRGAAKTPTLLERAPTLVRLLGSAQWREMIGTA